MKPYSKHYLPYLLLLAVFYSAGVAATPIVTSAERQIYIGDAAYGTAYGANSPYTMSGAFFDDITMPLGTRGVTVTSNQDSNIDPGIGLFAGSGESFVGFSVLSSDGVYAVSQYIVDFDLVADHYYSLTGQLYANMDGGNGVASFSLVGATGLSYSATNWESTDLTSAGILQAGSYELIVSSLVDNGGDDQSLGYMGGMSSFDFDLQLRETETQDVPEPGTLVILATGLIGLVWRKRTS